RFFCHFEQCTYLCNCTVKMRKTASKSIKLVLITSVLASCAQPRDEQATENKQRVFRRADTTAPYTEVTDNYSQGHSGGGMGSALDNRHPHSVAGTNAAKAAAHQAQRCGFGRSAASSPRSSYGS